MRHLPAEVSGAFLYPPTELLRERGYYSWPGAGFDAEGRQKEYAEVIGSISRRLGMKISLRREPVYGPEGVGRFVGEVKEKGPDGLLLVLLQKGEWGSVVRIVDEVGVPTVVFVPVGVLLNPQINQLHRRKGVYVVSSLDIEGLEYGMRMIGTAKWMGESRIVNVAGDEEADFRVEDIFGTQVRTVPLRRYSEEFRRTQATEEVRKLARLYSERALKVVEPSEEDILNSAKTYFVCKRIMESEEADAFMMDCLRAIGPEKPVPCMAYMSLRDEGVAMGCQSDLDATLTQMLLLRLFGRPGFQQNASCDTWRNHYYGAHCTCPTRLGGPGEPPEPYILRNHAETGTGVSPQVIWRKGQEVTMVHYIHGRPPSMAIYTGRVVGRYDMPPAGGCRTNVELVLDGVEDVCEVKGMHQTIIYGDHAKKLRSFCQLYGIEVID